MATKGNAGIVDDAFLQRRRHHSGVTPLQATVDSHVEGLNQVLAGKIDAYFADRAILLGLVRATDAPGAFIVGDRLYGTGGTDTVDLQLTASYLAFRCPVTGERVEYALEDTDGAA